MVLVLSLNDEVGRRAVGSNPCSSVPASALSGVRRRICWLLDQYAPRKSFPIHSIVCDNFREKFRLCDDSYRILTAFLHLRQNSAGIVEEFSKCRLIEQWSEFASTEDFHTVPFFYSYPLNIVLKGFLQSCSGNAVRLCFWGDLGLRKL